MTIDSNKALVRRFYAEVVSAGILAAVDRFIAPDYIDHSMEDAGRGPEVVRTHAEAVRRTFPDFTVEIDDQIAEGDKVVTRVTGRATHRGAWMGIQPTGVRVRVTGIHIDRVSDGRIVEHWVEADLFGLLRQMGVDPLGNV